jgi:hypothetical protein
MGDVGPRRNYDPLAWQRYRAPGDRVVPRSVDVHAELTHRGCGQNLGLLWR